MDDVMRVQARYCIYDVTKAACILQTKTFCVHETIIAKLVVIGLFLDSVPLLLLLWLLLVARLLLIAHLLVLVIATT